MSGSGRATPPSASSVSGPVDQRASTEAASARYGLVVGSVVPVTSTRVAEMVKLLENRFRTVLEHVPFDEAMRSSIDSGVVASDHTSFD